MTRLRISALLGAVALSTLLTRVAAANDTRSCFLPDGTQAPPEIVPCKSDADVSTCCHSSDYCLSNGLCLSAGSNNDFSQQGCTDSTWEGCAAHCPVDQTHPVDGFWYLSYCAALEAGNAGYCCGTDRSCCGKPDDLISIALFHAVFHPGQVDDQSRPKDDDGNSGGGLGRMAGIATVVSVTVIAVLALVCWLLLRRSRARDRRAVAAVVSAANTRTEKGKPGSGQAVIPGVSGQASPSLTPSRPRTSNVAGATVSFGSPYQSPAPAVEHDGKIEAASPIDGHDGWQYHRALSPRPLDMIPVTTVSPGPGPGASSVAVPSWDYGSPWHTQPAQPVLEYRMHSPELVPAYSAERMKSQHSGTSYHGGVPAAPAGMYELDSRTP